MGLASSGPDGAFKKKPQQRVISCVQAVEQVAAASSTVEVLLIEKALYAQAGVTHMPFAIVPGEIGDAAAPMFVRSDAIHITPGTIVMNFVVN